MFQQFLSTEDSKRAQCALRKLMRHDIRAWALTGGTAVEIYCLSRGSEPSIRSLNDLDFVTENFECIPHSLQEDFLCRHLHPSVLPGKMMLQVIDCENALRIDIFRATAAMMARATIVELPVGTIRIVSLEDLLARTTRLILAIAEGKSVPAKYVRDFLRLAELAAAANVERVWQEHRTAAQPIRFEDAVSHLRRLIPASGGLFVNPEYSKNTAEKCALCEPTAEFRLADPKVVLSILGYC